MTFLNQANIGVQNLSPYQAGKPVDELARELGLTDIVKLASNENPLGFPQSAKAAIQAQLDDLPRYPDANGFELKQTIATKFGLNPKQITLGNGSNDLLEITAHTFLSEHDEVIFSQYTFIVYPLVSKAINAKQVIVPAKQYGHDLHGFLAAITDKTKVIYIANPNNPTGTFLSAQEINEFLAQVPPHIVVVLDEAYTEFTAPNERVPSFELLRRYPNLLICRTFSKAYGLAGLRVGYLVSSEEVADLLNRIRQPFNCNSLALAAAKAVLNDDEFVEKTAANNAAGLRQLSQFFEQKGLEYVPSKGNFIMLNLQQPAAPIYQKLLEQGVIVRPIAGYGLPNHLRISIGLPEENQRFIDALTAVLGL
ncbi:histidinol-phosphate transaminase [Spirabiliibacterium falconis]|uniref:histidinol-phosphate transaminase n=1 Tax=Spirabiliibacterium falconis TaxID=572023 RepID=UPI001AACC588|nr:histidinol-phosphate transaminase [Spirabiliibacterium falconis]MBE2894266.1 histidinol-phosphate transaminase [Spirabiliibacterium falconis]